MDEGPNSGIPTFNWAIAKWNWTEVCGEKGFYIWDANQKDLGLCFSIIGIQLPLLTLFSVVSAYYFGKPTGIIERTTSQLCTIWLRCIIVLLMALLPIVQICLLTIQSNKLGGLIINLRCKNILNFTTHYFLRCHRLRYLPPGRDKGDHMVCPPWTVSGAAIETHFEHSWSIIMQFSLVSNIYHRHHDFPDMPHQPRTIEFAVEH
jgi:hypothetical protein